MTSRSSPSFEFLFILLGDFIPFSLLFLTKANHFAVKKTFEYTHQNMASSASFPLSWASVVFFQLSCLEDMNLTTPYHLPLLRLTKSMPIPHDISISDLE